MPKTLELTPDLERAVGIFHPFTLERMRDIGARAARLVYYTTADAAMHILRNKEVWMRQSSCMNDYSEVEYGLALTQQVYNESEEGRRFQTSLEELFPGINEEIAQRLKNLIPHLVLNTYLTCVSEHLDEEDAFGRLSMWRAYGGSAGVALVLDNSVFLTPADGLKAYSSPVAYLDRQSCEVEFAHIADNARAEAQFLRGLGREEVIGRVVNMFRFAAVCTKHPGFAEEREWRVIYCPTIEESPHLPKVLLPVNGLPQYVYKIPLQDIPEAGYFGAVSRLVARIIIGPTQYPRTLFEAFVELLGEAGVKEPHTKVTISDIPLRR